MQNRWDDVQATGLDELDQLVYMSRLVGAETALVVWGGGNSSVKVTEPDYRGRETPVLRVKGSGSDMKSIQRRDFPGVRMDDVLALLERDAMTDEEMVAYLEQALMAPGSPRPSIETLLHGFLPQRSILHSHADAILSLTNTRRNEEPIRAAFGDEVAIVPYRRPGFRLSREVFAAVSGRERLRGVVLMNHGLITWGDSAREAYSSHITLVTQAESYLRARAAAVVRPSPVPADASPERREEVASALAPVLRGALSRRRRVILRFDDTDHVLQFLARQGLERLVEPGAATPDHLIQTRQRPLVLRLPLDDLDAARRLISEQVEGYARRYLDYVARHDRQGVTPIDPYPRVMLVPGLGMWTAGADARRALIAGDIYHHTIEVVTGAGAVGGYTSLSEQDAFDAEYWPLELYKLTRLPAERELSRRVALITGAGSGIGRDIARRFAEEGAHLVLADIDVKAASGVVDEITEAASPGRAIAVPCDVASEPDVTAAFSRAALAFGGVDVVVSNAGIAVTSAIEQMRLEDWERSFAVNARGHFLVAREAVRVMKQQGTGGSLVFIATKNVTVPGKEFGAYSAAKAAEAQLARVVAIEHGADGIRANIINPDAVFEGSHLWSEEVRRERAAAHGIGPEELEDFYRRRNLLQVQVTGRDVAETALFLAGDRSAKTSGAMIPVDGGLREGFPR